MNKREAEEIVKESEDYPRYHGKLNGVNYNQAKGFLECYAQVEPLVLALKYLYLQTADYIRINNLGDIHHNHTMKDARDALAQWDSLQGKEK